jgi:PAS domain-containing protein
LQSEEPLRQFETVHVGQPDVRKYYTRRPRRGYYQSVIGIINVYRSGEPHVGHARSVMLQRTVGAPLEEWFVDFIFQPIRDIDSAVSGIFVEGSDVTDVVRAKTALSDNEERLRQLVNAIPHFSWTAFPGGFIHLFNDQ